MAGTDSGLLDIDTLGTLTFLSAPDFESPMDADTNNIYDVIVIAQDSVGNSDSLSAFITVLDVNEDSLVVLGDSIVTINENTTFVGSYTASSPVSWTLAGTDSGLLDIDTLGTLTFLSAPDFESPIDADTNNIYDVIVIALDSLGNSDSLSVAITVVDVDETLLVIAGNDSVTVLENSTLVDSYTSTKEGVWSIAGVDSALFSIDSLGVLSFISAPDYESPGDLDINNIYELTIIILDSIGVTDSLNIVVTVSDQNDVAPIIVGSDSLSIDENVANGYQLIALGIDDPDSTNAFSWIINSGNTDVNGNSQSAFAIDVDGVLTVNDSSDIDFELQAIFFLEILLNDGVTSDTMTLTVTINDVAEDITAPIITINDLLTNDISPELTGSVDDSTAVINVSVDGSSYAATNNSDGTWTLAQGTIADLAEGLYSIAAIAADSVGNADTVTANLTVDLTAPTVSVDTLETLNASPALSGSVDDTTALVQVIIDAITYDAVNNSDGNWTLSSGVLTGLTVGTYEVEVVATDLAGNVGTDSTTEELTILAGTPVALDATGVGYFEFTANWESSAGAVNYRIDVATDITFVNRVSGFNDLSVADTSIFISNLEYNTSYFYRVRVEYLSGDVSVNSNIITVKTLSDPATTLDSLALLSIRSELGGSQWINNNWTLGVAIKDWSGVTMTGTRVTGLSLPSNNLIGAFPTISSGLEQLTILNVSGNEITSIGDLSNLAALETVDISNNKLQFGSIEPIIAQASSVTYSPQKVVLSRLRTLEEIGGEYTVDRTLTGSANQYSWTKNGASITQTSGSFVVAINNFSADGSYVANVTSTAVPGLTLTTAPVVLRVSSLERDSTSLRTVYDSLNGSSSTLSDWTTLPIDQWSEVTITDSRVTNIDLSAKELSGSIPEDILDIRSLITADFSDNDIDGLTDLSGSLPNLTSFDVSGNRLTFEDLEVNAAVSALDYSSQQLIGAQSSEVLPVGSSYSLEVSVGGTSNSYSWTLANDLDTAVVASLTTSEVAIESLSYENMGIYSLEVTNSLVPGLTLQSEDMQILASADLEFKALDLGNETFTTGEGYAIKVIPGEEFDTIQTVRGAGTGFAFNDLILGDYLIAVAPDNLLEFLPTYFESTDLWTEADTLELRADFSDTLRMSQIPGETPGDIGISGTVTRDDGQPEGRINARRKVKRAGCSVRRFVPKGRTGQDDEDGTYELYAYVQSDDEGRFEFTNLEAGTYRFNIEYPGIPMDPDSYVEFTIGEGGIEDEVLILEATITDDGIVVQKIERLGFYRKYFKDLNVYPNPANQYVNISYSKLMSETVKVRLIDLEGNVVVEQLIEKGYDKELQLDVSSISGGIYLLNFIDTSEGSEKITTFKVYVKH
ncbi:MAG: hypothetical protein CMB80_04895 [Flammeovirgaceae bacterium]|nr:hypothetical protein [Flammeovirgaceae bacterium]MBE63633.1 hypothetical protein [Flammeovirgaceae bacterium]